MRGCTMGGADIVAVLVVPSDGDPGGLLREGPCLARAPFVQRPGPTAHWLPTLTFYASAEKALVLWWDGRFVPEGWLRLQLCTMLVNLNDPEEVQRRAQLPERLWQTHWPTQAEALQLVEEGQRVGVVARVVCLDSEGREVTDGR